ncbi:MAG: Gfo/Idh/MocA family oxidoreductase [Gemmatimonadota bacterium]
MSGSVRVAVLGAGGASQVVHLPILKRLRAVEVVGLADVQKRKARTIAERFEIPHVAEDLAGLAERTEFDVAVICLPNFAHEEAVLEALRLGAHVLCERPLTVTAESARRLVKAADRAGVQLLTANNHRFRYDVRAIRHFVENGDLGPIRHVRASWLNRRAARPRRGWRRERDKAGGGVLMDLGALALDLALWILGYPEVERVLARTWGPPEGVEVGASVQLTLAAGGAITTEVTWELVAEQDHHQVFVIGSEGTADSAPFRITRRGASGVADVTPPLSRPATALYQDSYRQEWAEFLRGVRGEKPVERPDDQVALLEVLEACYRSAEQAREVAL